MGYVITQVNIKNLKYVDAEKALVIESEKANIVVLNGQNGYGKTTFFDALELLFTAKIEHMTSVANRQISNGLEDLVFDKNQDIDIMVKLENGSGDTKELRRIFDHSNSYVSKLYCNNEEITNEDLQNRFGYTDNIYGMGIYMSQNRSLTFLEKKLKDRKSVIAELFNTKEANDKVAFINNISKGLKNKIEEKKNFFNDKRDKVCKEIEGLQKELQISLKTLPAEKNYNLLFPGKDYEFDKEFVDFSKSFQVFVEPLRHIKDYIRDYDSFVIKNQNDKLLKGISLPKQLFLKKYYLNIFNEIENKKATIRVIEKATIYKNKIDSGEYLIDEDICRQLGINKADIELVSKKCEKLNEFNAGLSKNEEIILNVNKMRNELISQYLDGVENGAVDKDVCPLCGVSHAEIVLVFKNVEDSLVSSIALRNDSKKELEADYIKTFNSIIAEPLNRFLEINSLLYQNYEQIKSCIDLDVQELSDLLQEFKIEFGCGEDTSISLSNFDEEYNKVLIKLKTCMHEEKVIINPEMVEIYKSISVKYYDGGKPSHSISDIDNKIEYIANCYASESQKKLQKLREELEKIEKKKVDFENKSDALQKNIEVLNSKYTSALKDYQTKLVEAIKIPVLIYSGKIIQNYPLGLAIKTKITESQLSFEPYEKEGVDVINILSTGQLNGLALSIMLSIRSVYGSGEGLDFILIDDPLQTIDDISAISLVDLLLNSKISQAIISTHENRIAKMLEYKYKKRKLSFKEINMMREYLVHKNS